MDPFYTEKASGYESIRHETLSMSRSMRNVNQHEPSPGAEIEGKMRNPQRRRVPVAVNSRDMGIDLNCPNWTYTHMGTTIVPTSRFGAYTSATPGKPTTFPVTSPSARMPAFQRTSDFDLGSPDGSAFPDRPAPSVDSIHYEDGPSAHYSQSPAYMLPNAPSAGLVDYSATPWSPKLWGSILGGNRSTNGVYPDSEVTNGSLHQPPFPYMLPSHGVPSTEVPQTTPTAMATGSCADCAGSSRTLPTPTSRSQQPPVSTAGLSLLGAEGNSHLPLVMDHKSFWATRYGLPPDQRSTTADSIPSNILFSHNPPSPVPKCEGTSSNPSELLYTYHPMPTTTESATTTLPSSVVAAPSAVSGGNPVYPVLESLDDASAEDRSTTTERSLSRSAYHERSTAGQRISALTADCTVDIYGYAGSERTKSRLVDGTDGRCSTGTLMNGLPYTRVPHADTSSSAFSFNNLLPDALPEYHRSVVTNVHRPPVSLGNNGAY
ncbi:hypothetical protein N7462_000209 [Penicillium macrosclerotiorum]|uniref:uncharacterized protein n=1 Tax=Penicillium macrosclerotiorum TaxID=303699 RepID=UPI002546888E|nr:uncharacterized protein N7462_000209 [Penicillium macrosclerotiorum]KAJ5698204.1 hypothetical protein N7462_000209 [Penicillium macrosclerotiorum]